MKVYVGYRSVVYELGVAVPLGAPRVSVFVDGRPLKHVGWHSPDGFEWGYGGSGPADLALSILVDFFGENDADEEWRWESKAIRLHQEFKWAFVSKFPHDEWTLTSDEIENWLAMLEVGHGEAIAAD